MPEALLAALREKAGDGSTDFIVELRQTDLSALLDGDGSTDFIVELRQTDLSALLDEVEELRDERKLGPQPHRCNNGECSTISYGSGYSVCPHCGGTEGRDQGV